MSFSWSDFLPVAKALRATGDEASLRAAISRAYYGVFGEAKEFAESEKDEEFPIGSIHESVINYYDGSQDDNRIAFAANLRRLKSHRVRADYHRNRAVDVKFADQAIHEATLLMADLATIKSPAKT